MAAASPIRAPRFADDGWYPASAERLATTTARLLGPRASLSTQVTAAVTPHAGWRYSGAVAGATFGGIVIPDRVVVVGPNHRGLGARRAIDDAEAWAMPGGAVAIDAVAADDLVAASSGWLVRDGLAHRFEHAIELAVPFLQACNPQVQLVPLSVSGLDLAGCVRLGELLADRLRAWPGRTLLVASSDMNHFESAAVGNAKDRAAIERMLACDARGLFDVVAQRDISMCGVLATTAVMTAAARIGAARATLVRYQDSGDVSGDKSSVVGYAGLRFDCAPPSLLESTS